MHVVLYRPQIPQNTGNVVRTCSVTGSKLTLIGPLGFSVSSRHLKRAGLDYWEGVDISIEEDFTDFLKRQTAPLFFFSSKAKTLTTTVHFPSDAVLIFGSETEGLPEWTADHYPDRLVRIPMCEGARCFNLATAVGMGVYAVISSQGSGS